MRKIIYTRPDGQLCVVHPVRNTHPIPETLTDAEIEKRAWGRLPADAIGARWVEESDLPTDRSFRNAWQDSGKKVEVDMDKCREIHRDRLRAARAPEFAANDLALRDAMLSGDKEATAKAIARRDELRDVTDHPSIDAAKSVEELKALWPEQLSA